jgi:hypothetical protein
MGIILPQWSTVDCATTHAANKEQNKKDKIMRMVFFCVV